MVEATVVAHRDAWMLTEVALGDARLVVPAIDAPPGTRLRIRIRARDVALARSEPVDSSIGGRLPGFVAEIVERDGPYAEVRVDIGGASLWSLVTRQSLDRARAARRRSRLVPDQDRRARQPARRPGAAAGRVSGVQRADFFARDGL